jgi:aminomethyltransferase
MTEFSIICTFFTLNPALCEILNYNTGMKKLSEKDLEAYKACRNSIAISIPKEMSLIRVTGKDHLQFIQGQSTNDILSLEDGQGQPTAFLTPKAKVRSIAAAFRCKDCLYLLVPEMTCAPLMKHLDMYIVMEDVEMEILDHKLLAVSGPGSKKFLEETIKCDITPKDLYDHQQLEWNDMQLPLCLINLYGETTFLFFVKDPKELCTELNKANHPILNEHLQKILRVEAGIPRFPDDIDENTLFPETGLQTEYVNYNKGCFVGQEIVARVKYRGSVNRSLTGIIFEDDTPQEIGEFSVRGQKAGRITTTLHSPLLNKYISFAYISKKFRTPGQRINLEIAESSLKSRVVLLPFYIRQSELEEALNLYHQAELS